MKTALSRAFSPPSSATRIASCSQRTSLSPMKMAPFWSIETVIGLSVVSTALASVLGSSTGTPTVSSGAEIMKMISSTSMTSTSGVTLISLSGRLRARRRPRPPLEPPPPPIAMDQAPRRRFRSADGGGGGGGGAEGAPRRRAMADCRSSAKASRRPVNLPAVTEKALKAI
ncbi:hypothetical protein D3C85_1092320 [compost metagenome]